MGENSEISWCDHTLNFWIGCAKISPACDHCYAERDNDRRKWVDGWGVGVPRHRTKTAHQAISWNKKAAITGYRPRVFAMSLADVFDNEVPPEWRSDFWQLLRETPNLRWILLTKRIGNARKMLPTDWPFPHVGLMSTLENQEVFNRDWRKLAETPAAWHGISCEPLLGHIDISPWLDYYPIHEAKAKRDFCLSSGDEWRFADYAGRNDLESTQENMGRGDSKGDQHPLQESEGRERYWEIFANSANGRQEEDLRSGASSGFSPLQGNNSGRTNNKSRERKNERQSSEQFGTGDLFGTAIARSAHFEDESYGSSERRNEFEGKTDIGASQNNTYSARDRRDANFNSEGFQNKLSSNIEDSTRGKVAPLCWVISGGESGPGFRALDMDAVRSLRDQCARNGVTFHHKQNGGLTGKAAGCLVDGVEHKNFPSQLAA